LIPFYLDELRLSPEELGETPDEPSPDQLQPGLPAPVSLKTEESGTTKVKCPTCGTNINVRSTGKSVEIVCPACGTKGTL